MSHTVLMDDEVLNKYRDKWVLVEGHPLANNIEIAANYGYKKLISLRELMVLYPTVSPLIGLDFMLNGEAQKKTLEDVLARFKLSADELR